MTAKANKRLRLIIFFIIFWLLTWSLFWLILYNSQLNENNRLSSSIYLSLLAIISLLIGGWTLFGYFFIYRWSQISIIVTELMDRNRIVYWFVWLFPAILWSLGFALFLLIAPVDGSLLDGSLIVLSIVGGALIIYLLKYHGAGEEIQNRPPTILFVISKRFSFPQRTAVNVPKNVIVLLIISGTVLFTFRHALFNPDTILFGHDVFNLHYMFESFVQETLASGRLPLWNPYIFSGSPVINHPQYLLFYPPQMFFRLLPLNLSLSWSIAFHIWLAGLGMYLLSRYLKLPWWISLICALIYMLNSGMLGRVFGGHPWLIYALAWFPFAWLFVMKALDTGKVLPTVLAVLCVALIILTGHPTFPLYILMFLGLYWLYICFMILKQNRGWRSIGILTLRFMLIMIGAIGLSAIQIIPAIPISSQVSLSSGYDFNYANFLALYFPDLLAFLIPQFYLTTGKQNIHFELVPYLGVLFVLLLPLIFAVRSQRSLVYFLGGILLFALALAFGGSLGIFSIIYSLVPPFRVARIPPRAFTLFIPAAVLLVGVGLQTIRNRLVMPHWFTICLRIYFAAAFVIFGIGFGHWLNQDNALSDRLMKETLFLLKIGLISLLLISMMIVFSNYFFKQSSLPTKIATPIILVIAGGLIGIIVVPIDAALTSRLLILASLIGIYSWLLLSFYEHSVTPFGLILLLVFILFDLGVSNTRHIYTVAPPVTYDEERVLLETVTTQSLDRIATTIGEPDQYMLGKYNHIDGYNSGILAPYEIFLRTVSATPGANRPRILTEDSQFDPRALEFLGVKYIISPQQLDNDEFQLIEQYKDNYLYENLNPLPRAFMVYNAQNSPDVEQALNVIKNEHFDYSKEVVLLEEAAIQPKPGGQADVTIDTYIPSEGHLALRVNTSSPGILVISEPYFSERQVRVNGQEVSVIRANVGFMAVALPAGNHHVELGYVPTSLYVGAAITGLTILLLIGYAILSYIRGKKGTKINFGLSENLNLLS